MIVARVTLETEGVKGKGDDAHHINVCAEASLAGTAAGCRAAAVVERCSPRKQSLLLRTSQPAHAGLLYPNRTKSPG